MHKDFYASGFLYNPLSQQILLQQQKTTDGTNEWSLFTSKVTAGGNGEEVFSEEIAKKLNLKVSIKNIHYIYTHFSTELNKDHSIYYAEAKTARKKYPETGDYIFGWFNFKQIHKLKISEQVKHDIMVGQRVIDSATRKSLGQQTIG